MVVSFSYAYIKYETKEKNENIIGTECIKIEMEELTEALNLYHAYPMKEETGSKTDAYQFKIRNACGVGVDYQVELEVESVEEESKLLSKDIAVKLDTNNKITLTEEKRITEKEQETYELGKGSLKPYEERSHEVRIWIDESAGNESQNKIFKSKVVIEAVQNEIAIYSEPLLQGADPVLGKGMVAVEIGENGEVTKADPTAKWYEYGKKKWANAVILANGKTEEDYEVGDQIEESDIESYFVWIPKYSYKLFNEKLGEYTSLEETVEDKGPTTAIEIRFGLEDTKDGNSNECTTPGKSGDIGKCKNGDWMTHPAFLAFDTTGLWVGKFETGYKQTEDFTNIENWTIKEAEQDKTDQTKVIIKPNVYSWRNISIANMYQNSFDYQRNLDSHMMKNTEWGAVAYLSHSKYGICDDDTCLEVRINNSQNFVTGYNESTTYPSSQNASTTGNNTGIFDMSAGAWEYVMAVMTTGTDGKSLSLDNIYWGLSGLTNGKIINKKYIDLYTDGTVTQYNHRILGDATGEMGPFSLENGLGMSSWYHEMADFIHPDFDSYWFVRSGNYFETYNRGLFYFGSGPGNGSNLTSFRIVLAPTNSVS